HYQSGSKLSFTNDASLLLPSHVYRDEYMVMTRGTTKLTDSTGLSTMIRPGFVAIVGVEGGTTRLGVNSSAHTMPSDIYSNTAYPPLVPGLTANIDIEPYEVLQILSAGEPGCTDLAECDNGDTLHQCCNAPPEYDLTGTMIKVMSGPNPAVFAGTVMSFVPYNVWAADHLEEQMPPLETWGAHYLCAHTVTQAAGEPSVWRVLSGSDNNAITFNPASVNDAVTLAKGEYIEFESLADFEVTSEGRTSIGQFMVGQNYTAAPPNLGDPSMTLAVPVEQYQRSYTFLAPGTYVYNYITVTHRNGAFPLLDGDPVAGDTVDITAEYARTNMTIDAGIHHIQSDEPFGLQVYGVGTSTSYMYPGGLGLKRVSVPVE
ncbi:MAG: IgGFc-binding protein, partial [Deltaproteobacteria bacterium]|nr:IgGFc-binding protein [Deltaproteobacteria bacterium]